MEGWNSSFRIGAAAQDPEDDDWKQRPRYACPRKVCCFFFPEISTGGNTSKSVGGLVLNIPPHESLQVGMRVCFVWFQWNDVGLYTMDFHIWV